MADDYEVGYGKPPKHTRFRKGQSGNFLGRPKGSTNVQTEMKRLLVAKTKIKVNGAIRDGADIEGPVSCSHSEGHGWRCTRLLQDRRDRRPRDGRRTQSNGR